MTRRKLPNIRFGLKYDDRPVSDEECKRMNDEQRSREADPDRALSVIDELIKTTEPVLDDYLMDKMDQVRRFILTLIKQPEEK